MSGYAELHCLSNFSFQRGASHPQELVTRAAGLGYRALALTDECSLAGVVRAWEAAKPLRLPLIIGSEFQLADGPKLVLLAPDKAAYAQLGALITHARRRSPKGRYRLTLADLDSGTDRLLALWLPRWPAQGIDEATLAGEAEALAARFADRLWLAFERLLHPQDRVRHAALAALGRRLGRPLVASGDVHMHVRERQPLQDVLACIGAHTHVHDPAAPLFPNAERHLRELSVLQKLYPAALLGQTLAIAERCTFRLDELRYQYPAELVPPGMSAAEHLRALTEAGMRRRYPDGCPPAVRAQVDKELALIAELGYEHYFLTVEELVAFARSRGILCQGRGSAANSAVCYLLGVTEVDPARMDLLFERFISKERGEPPDIDIDFEHQRREEVIQHIYQKYGRERAALACTVQCYRTRGALRDVGKALGLTVQQVDAVNRALAWWDDETALPAQLQKQGLAPDGATVRHLLRLTRELTGMPRHLSQHVGGFVISQRPLSELVPVENAAMAERTVIQWDKDDLDAMGILKVDVLALGMLSALRRCLELVGARRGRPFRLQDIPAEDAATYAMIGRGETTGVFQIESRAQMSMLPRLKPRTFWDLVIEVAIVRPGPIQGDMVHPYLRRRQGLEPVHYPSDELRQVLAPTLGVPLFQEQVMSIAIRAAGFTPGEADQVRRSMAAWQRKGGLDRFRDKLLAGMAARGYDADFAEAIYRRILGFGSYGFPMSHAASFALLTYASCWLKCHEPAAFCAALLNSQPLGFYAPAQLINEARRMGVCFRPVDVQRSAWDCTLEAGPDGAPEVRLGLNQVRGLPAAEGQGIVTARAAGPFGSVQDLAERAGLGRRALDALAGAGALASLAGHRHGAHWQAAGVRRSRDLLAGQAPREAPVALPPPREGQDIAADYRSLGLTLGRHPLALLRGRLDHRRVCTAAALAGLPDGRLVRVAGIVTHRQRPGTASGVVFVTLEDETGSVNLVVWPRVLQAQREAVLGARLMLVHGHLQAADGVIHVVAGRVEDASHLLGGLAVESRDFH
ncbi:error-prone DNA polymerase [Immundisolibacter sp.]|uniref:error-prone DNA polymerase n=1 Tax=Immundisolibacter sp. TaxID=1934948 RepID=UPI00261DE070|nr:error-prone DNA polymerase [Immundisolibacter sp.]MDD3650446.1 error-prone DNA polymerase [Immundisolibacter sp.]